MMTQTRFTFHSFAGQFAGSFARRGYRPSLGPLALMLLLTACGDSASTDSFVYKMGEKVSVGSLVYTVLEAEWKSELSGGSGALPQTPKHRFLVMKLAMTNGGGAQATIPLLTVENGNKESTMEVSEVKDLPSWLGLVRLVNPAQTDQGYIVFDVPTGAYKLRVTDGKETGSETTRLIDIPLSLSEPARN